ncbi:hypothetical protein Droror1_Dr00027331 [Drosera rotundifolia]
MRKHGWQLPYHPLQVAAASHEECKYLRFDPSEEYVDFIVENNKNWLFFRVSIQLKQVGRWWRKNRSSGQKGRGNEEGRALGGGQGNGLGVGRGKQEGEGRGKRRKGRVSGLDLGGFLRMFVGDVAVFGRLDLGRSNGPNAFDTVGKNP